MSSVSEVTQQGMAEPGIAVCDEDANGITLGWVQYMPAGARGGGLIAR